MTNRELLLQAMPLYSLSEEEWNLFISHLDKVKNPQLLQILEKIKTNQSRLEVIGNYLDYFADAMEEPVRVDSVQIRA